MFIIKLTLVFLSLVSLDLWLISSSARADSTEPNRGTVPNRDRGGGTYAYDRGQVPGRYRGGGRRGNCPSVPVPLTALTSYTANTAANGLPIVYVGGVTTLARPSLWFYMPYLLDDNLNAEFLLKDAAGRSVYSIASANFPITERTPGLIEIALPPTVELEVGTTYHWYFKVNCEAESSVYTEGGIERIPLDSTLKQQLMNASPQEKVALYQANGIWYDAIATLAPLYRAQPTDSATAADWQQLLQAINITDMPEP